MSIIVADTFKARVVGAAITTENGLNVGGACTSTSYVGPLTGDVTGEVTGDVTGDVTGKLTGQATALSGSRTIGGVVFDNTGNINLPGVNQSGTQNTSGTAANLSGTPDITIRNVTGVAATFTGVLTYEDVTNVDSVGFITARSGIKFGAAGIGGTVTGTGQAEFVGVVTASQFVGGGSGLTGLNIPAGFTELDAALFN